MTDGACTLEHRCQQRGDTLTTLPSRAAPPPFACQANTASKSWSIVCVTTRPCLFLGLDETNRVMAQRLPLPRTFFTSNRVSRAYRFPRENITDRTNLPRRQRSSQIWSTHVCQRNHKKRKTIPSGSIYVLGVLCIYCTVPSYYGEIGCFSYEGLMTTAVPGTCLNRVDRPDVNT